MRLNESVRHDPGAYVAPYQSIFPPTIGERFDDLVPQLDAIAKAAQERAGIEAAGIEGKADDLEAT